MDITSWYQRANKEVNIYYYILSILFGIITTIFVYNGYGISNHIEQLPQILRQIDSSYLENDFFVNTATDSTARYYYSLLISSLSPYNSYLPYTFLFITTLSNVFLSVITFITSRKIFCDKRAGIYSSAFVMSISTFSLGYKSTIYSSFLTPYSISFPLILLSLILFLYGRKNSACISIGLSSLIHPLIGLELGTILVFFFFIYAIYKGNTPKKLLLDWCIPFIFLTFFYFLVLVPYFSKSNISSGNFIDIIAYFRHPHHYVPSTFDATSYIYGFCFLFVVLSIIFTTDNKIKRVYSYFFSYISLSLILLCLGGYVFVEIIPVEIWVTAQPFRLLILLKWIGLIVLGGFIGVMEDNNNYKHIYPFSVINPIVAFTTETSRLLSQKVINTSNSANLFPYIHVSIPLIVLLYTIITPSRSSIVLVFIFVFSICAVRIAPRLYTYISLPSSLAVMLVLITFSPTIPSVVPGSGTMNRITQNFSMQIEPQLDKEAMEVVKYAQNNTPHSSTFLTPPNWGQFRLLANRSIVVDLKSFPFTDKGIYKWYRRVENLYLSDRKPYTTENSIGSYNFTEHYFSQNPSYLIKKGKEYSADYIVLSNTQSYEEKVFENEKYKIIRTQ